MQGNTILKLLKNLTNFSTIAYKQVAYKKIRVYMVLPRCFSNALTNDHFSVANFLQQLQEAKMTGIA